MSVWRTSAVSALLSTMFALAVPSQQLAAQQIAPPAPDETLIYVLREGRFAGGGATLWVALNDQTVARLGNNDYAVVRAKAGANTLNLAAAGMVHAAIAIDDRPGETIYLQWRLGEYVFREIDATLGAEFVAKGNQTKPPDEPLGNQERAEAMLSLARLGFDLMRPAGGQREPDAGHALLTIVRGKELPELNLGVWAEDRYLGNLQIEEGMQVLLTPGEHFLLTGYFGVSLLKADVEAGRSYYALLDVGGMLGRAALSPVKAGDRRLKARVDEAKFVELNADALTPRVREREKIVTDWVRYFAERAGAGQEQYEELNREHAN